MLDACHEIHEVHDKRSVCASIPGRMLIIITTILALVAGVVYLALTFSGALEEPPKEFKPAVSDLKKKKIKTKQKKVDITATLKSAKGDKKKSKKKADDGNHPQMAHALKGHAGTVTGLDFTGKGTILCSTSVDRTLRAWKIKPHQEHIPYTRVNMKFDHATACAISADSRGVAVATKEEKKIQVYKLKLKNKTDARPEMEFVHEFPTPHQDAIKSIAWGPNNAFIMTCGRGLDTCIYLHSPSGKLLQKLDTKQITNHMATISHDGKWLAAGTRLSDCKLWELKYDGSTGAFDKAVYTMNLRGHRRGMNSISFGPPSTNMVATASADGTWKVWSIDVRYKSSEDAKIIVDKQTEFKEVDLICLNPKVPAYNEVSIVGVASETTLQFCNAATGEVLQSIDTAHRDFINHITFTPEGDYMVTCGGDKNVKFWKCPPFPAKEE